MELEGGGVARWSHDWSGARLVEIERRVATRWGRRRTAGRRKKEEKERKKEKKKREKGMFFMQFGGVTGGAVGVVGWRRGGQPGGNFAGWK